MNLKPLQNQVRVIGALLLREAGINHGKSLAFGFLTDAVEPLLIIASISTLRTLLDAQAHYGTSVVLFIGTGVFPIYMFIRATLHIRGPVGTAENPKYPKETTLDRVIVHAVIHFVAASIVALVFFSALYAYGERQALPADLWNAIISMLVLFFLGLGIGLANAVVGELVPVWSSIWAGLSRVMLHFSGIYFVPDYLPPISRQYFMINPVLHGVSWFRHSFYPMYPNVINNHRYLVICTLIAVTSGLTLERVLHKRTVFGE